MFNIYLQTSMLINIIYPVATVSCKNQANGSSCMLAAGQDSLNQ